jgi:hypothetical protein
MDDYCLLLKDNMSVSFKYYTYILLNIVISHKVNCFIVCKKYNLLFWTSLLYLRNFYKVHGKN